MAYEKNTWANGDVITAEKLNHIEDGIASGGGVLEIQIEEDDTGSTMNKTWNEINTAFSAGTVCFALEAGENYSAKNMVVGVCCSEDPSSWLVTLAGPYTMTTFICNSPDDYPSFIYEDIENGNIGGNIGNDPTL